MTTAGVPFRVYGFAPLTAAVIAMFVTNPGRLANRCAICKSRSTTIGVRIELLGRWQVAIVVTFYDGVIA